MPIRKMKKWQNWMRQVWGMRYVEKAWKRKKPKKKKRKNFRTKNQTMARRTCTVCN
ncbi:hypothetical protein DAPPUDRAFT_306839 [Daphnia pulex]|uniref:Uncharacterized protein n=1 Tax=Daphnia pulex TaxID=6669 RepID=E9GYW8_DAPPU|nr:hypothetical protein DAPPUDRAFT_306839 [Daphnia pulex]|eukprot:EFX75228.1 hypothetical protein DAPPUDRAFT_306839 [Daphnia pulex]